MSHPLLSFPLKPWIAVAGVALTASTAWAADPFVIKDIKVEGLQRVEAATVFASIPVKVGDTYSDERGAAAIRSLFALGLFQDVHVDVRGDNMVIVVQERPVIHSVDVNAGKEIDKATLLGGLADGDVEIGPHATVGACALVTRSVPPLATVVGVPAKVVRVGRPPWESEDARTEELCRKYGVKVPAPADPLPKMEQG